MYEKKYFNQTSYFLHFFLASILLFRLFRFFCSISKLQALKVAAGINVPLPFLLDGALKDVNSISSDAEAALDVEAILVAIVSMAVFIAISSKLSSRLSASSRVLLLLALVTLGLRICARPTNIEESVELDPVSDFEERDEDETFSLLFTRFNALKIYE